MNWEAYTDLYSGRVGSSQCDTLTSFKSWYNKTLSQKAKGSDLIKVHLPSFYPPQLPLHQEDLKKAAFFHE